MMRMRRRSLVGAAVATAAVVGTANAVSHHQQQKYAGQEAAAQQQQDMAYQQGVADAQAQQQQAAPQMRLRRRLRAPRPRGGSDLTSQLQQLSQLHNAGVLSDEEFAAGQAEAAGGLILKNAFSADRIRTLGGNPA